MSEFRDPQAGRPLVTPGNNTTEDATPATREHLANHKTFAEEFYGRIGVLKTGKQS